MFSIPRNRASSGFTLAELLVAMALLSTLTAMVLPNVLAHIRKGEQRRLVTDLGAIHTATTAYYSDVSRWPASIDQLARPIAATDSDLLGNPYSSSLQERWRGPYLERELSGSGLKTGFSATVSPTFDQATVNGQPFLRIAVGHVKQRDARLVSLEIDGDTLVGNDGTGEANGSVRWVNAGTDSLVYLMRPIFQ